MSGDLGHRGPLLNSIYVTLRKSFLSQEIMIPVLGPNPDFPPDQHYIFVVGKFHNKSEPQCFLFVQTEMIKASLQNWKDQRDKRKILFVADLSVFHPTSSELPVFPDRFTVDSTHIQCLRTGLPNSWQVTLSVSMHKSHFPAFHNSLQTMTLELSINITASSPFIKIILRFGFYSFSQLFPDD